MNGVHDMGAMEGLGALVPDPTEAPFHAPWEGRVHALVLASPTRGNIDRGRWFRESIPGPFYLAMSYYERWFTALEAMLLDGGHLAPDEARSGRPAPDAPRAQPRLPLADVPAALARTGSYARAAPRAPAFAVGDAVRARVIHPEGHTRLPRYVRGFAGVIETLHGAHVFPDAHAHGRGEDPQELYTVRFCARTLFGPAARAGDAVSVDLFEPYLASV